MKKAFTDEKFSWCLISITEMFGYGFKIHIDAKISIGVYQKLFFFFLIIYIFFFKPTLHNESTNLLYKNKKLKIEYAVLEVVSPNTTDCYKILISRLKS